MSSTDLVPHYLASTGMCAVLALVAANGEQIRFAVTARPEPRLMAGVTVAGMWWAADSDVATRVVEVAYELAVANSVERWVRWLRMPAIDIPGLIAAAATRLGVVLQADRDLRRIAQVAVERIEAELEGRRRRGELRSVNRDYRESRVALRDGGERVPSYGDHMLMLKRRMVEEAARRNA